jgi:Kdo-III transferase WaaZ
MNLYKLWFKLTHSYKKWHHLDYLPEIRLITNANTIDKIIFKEKFEILPNKLENLLTSFKNQRVFLVGSGPSIKGQNIQLLAQEKTIFLNGAISLIESYKLIPTAFIVTDKRFIKKHKTLLFSLPPNIPCIFTLDVVREVMNTDSDFFQKNPLFLIEKATRPYLKNKIKIKGLDKNYFIKKNNTACTLDINHGFVEAGTVMYAAAQFTLSSKPKEIVLVGFDLGNSNKPRFYEDKNNKTKSKLDKALYKNIIPAFTLLSEICYQKDVQIYNASHLSKMPYNIISYTGMLEAKRE